jgi:hypothetical protein
VTGLVTKEAGKTEKQTGGSVRVAQIHIRPRSCTLLGQLSLPWTLPAFPTGKDAFLELELTSICTVDGQVGADCTRQDMARRGRRLAS